MAPISVQHAAAGAGPLLVGPRGAQIQLAPAARVAECANSDRLRSCRTPLLLLLLYTLLQGPQASNVALGLRIPRALQLSCPLRPEEGL